MNPGENKSGSSEPMTSANWFVMGSVISLVSALVLAWKGAICVEVLKILAARDPSDVHVVGQQLGRVMWCPLGVAIGTTIVAAGFRLAAVRGRLSQRAMIFLVLSDVMYSADAIAPKLSAAFACIPRWTLPAARRSCVVAASA